MPKFRVLMEQMASSVVEVEADDYEDAIEKAANEAPGTLCAQCSGWNNPPGIDLSYDWEPVSVSDEAGNTVWEEVVEHD